jgi:hypothetical protein
VFGKPVAVDSYVVGLPVVGGYVVGLRPEGRSESAEESQITVPRQPSKHNGFPAQLFSKYTSLRLRRRRLAGIRRGHRPCRLRSSASELSFGATGSSPHRGMKQESPPWRRGREHPLFRALAITRLRKRGSSGSIRSAPSSCQCSAYAQTSLGEPRDAPAGRRGCRTNPGRARQTVPKGGLRERQSRPSRACRPSRGRRGWLRWRAFPRARRGFSGTALCDSLRPER